MTQFAKVSKDSRTDERAKTGEGLEYYYQFINQYLKIPNSMSKRVDTEYSTEKSDGVRYCIGLILTNLVKYGVIAYSRRKDYYAKHGVNDYTWTNLKRAVDLIKGKYAFNRNGYKGARYDTGIASALHPLYKVYELPSKFKESLDFKTIPLIQIDKEPIFNLWDLKRYISNLPVNSKYSNNPQSLNTSPVTTINTSILSHNGTIYTQIFTSARTLNRMYFNKIRLDFTQLPNLRFQPLHQVCLTRIFNDDECGRWFQKGGLSYQQLSKVERPQILMNGQEITELDYSAMHPNLLYYWEGQQCPIDFYERIAIQLGVPYNDDTKFVIKRIALSSINASSELKLQQSISKDKKDEIRANATRRNEGREERPILYDELKRLKLDFKQIVEALKQAHPVISKYVYSNSANKLMLTESNIMTSVLVNLMNNKIPAIPMHDSVLFPKQYVNIVKPIMLTQYNLHTKFTINVK